MLAFGQTFISKHFNEATSLVSRLTVGVYKTYKADTNKAKEIKEAAAKLHTYNYADRVRKMAKILANNK